MIAKALDAIGGIAWVPLALTVVALLASRLRNDKKRYLDTLDHIENAATQIGAISGVPGSLAQDLDRCRSYETYRRKAGELLHDAHSEAQWSRYRARLREVDRAWSNVEDAVNSSPLDPGAVRTAREAAVVALQGLKSSFKAGSRWRLSIALFGPLPPSEK